MVGGGDGYGEKRVGYGGIGDGLGLETLIHGFGHALGFLFFLFQPTGKGGFLAGNTIEVAANAFGIAGLNLFEFRLNLNIFFGLAGPLGFSVFALFGGVGVDGFLAGTGVLEDVVDSDAGCIEGHEDGGTAKIFGEAAHVLAAEHVDNLGDAVAAAWGDDAGGAVDVVHGPELTLEAGSGIVRRIGERFFW